MIDWKRVGPSIQQHRKRAGNITQEVLAARLGVRLATIARLETGNRRPSLYLLEKIAVALGCSIHALLPEKTTSLAARTPPSLIGLPEKYRRKIALIQKSPMHLRNQRYEQLGQAFSRDIERYLTPQAFAYLQEIRMDDLPRSSYMHIAFDRFLQAQFPAIMAAIPQEDSGLFASGVVDGLMTATVRHHELKRTRP